MLTHIALVVVVGFIYLSARHVGQRGDNDTLTILHHRKGAP